MTALNLDILAPALLAGLLVLSTHVPLGLIVLGRGIIFIDIALAQVAALGVVFGNFMWGNVTGWTVQASAIAAALACSALLVWTDKRFPEIQEALIGVLYVLAAAVQIILLAYNPNGSEHLKDLLVGQILWVSPGQLVVVGALYAAVLVLWAVRDLRRERLLFYGVFAVVITASVQIVGMLLVFASLIVPALSVRAAPKRWQHAIAFNVGGVGYALGLLLSAVFNAPTGAAIVCTLIPIALGTAMVLGRRARAGGGDAEAVPAHSHAPAE